MSTSRHRAGEALLSIRYFQRVRNVGDQIAPLIVERLAGCAVRSISAPGEPHLLSIGSVYSGANRQSVVWGTGLMGPEFEVPVIEPRRIVALRGRLTLEALHARGARSAEVALGDPGILAARLCTAGQPVVAGRLGLVPHYFDWRHPAVQALLADPRVYLLDVHQPPHEFLRAMQGCQWVASSSLHGLIFADALGIPSVWLDIGGKLGGGHFKFLDYYSTTDLADPRPLQLAAETTVEQLVACARRADASARIGELEAAFPRAALEEAGALGTVPEGFVGVEAARARPVQVFVEALPREPVEGVEFVALEQRFARDEQTLQRILRAVARHFAPWAEIPRFALLFGEATDAPALRDALQRALAILHNTPGSDVLLARMRAGERVQRAVPRPLPGQELAARLAGDDPWLCCLRSPRTDVRSAKLAEFEVA
jgi:pyruvyltransferase